MKNITSFHGENRWLSNFWPVKVSFDGITYNSVEHAYQAAKTDNPTLRAIYMNCTAAAAKRTGRTFLIREDWEQMKLGVMENLLRQKFTHSPLREKLLATGNCKIVEGNTWGDVFWGVCKGKGENNLGKLIMKIRGELAQ